MAPTPPPMAPSAPKAPVANPTALGLQVPAASMVAMRLAMAPHVGEWEATSSGTPARSFTSAPLASQARWISPLSNIQAQVQYRGGGEKINTPVVPVRVGSGQLGGQGKGQSQNQTPAISPFHAPAKNIFITTSNVPSMGISSAFPAAKRTAAKATEKLYKIL